MKRRTAQAKQRAARKSSKHVPQTSKYAEKKRRQNEAIAWCSFCKCDHAGGATCMGHYP